MASAGPSKSSQRDSAAGLPLSPRSPLLRDGDEVDDDQDCDDESHLEAKAAQDGKADQGSLWALEAQVLGRLRLAHESDHRGGDDEVDEEELPIAQVGVELDKGEKKEGGTEETERCNGRPAEEGRASASRMLEEPCSLTCVTFPPLGVLPRSRSLLLQSGVIPARRSF